MIRTETPVPLRPPAQRARGRQHGRQHEHEGRPPARGGCWGPGRPAGGGRGAHAQQGLVGARGDGVAALGGDKNLVVAAPGHPDPDGGARGWVRRRRDDHRVAAVRGALAGAVAACGPRRARLARGQAGLVARRGCRLLSRGSGSGRTCERSVDGDLHGAEQVRGPVRPALSVHGHFEIRCAHSGRFYRKISCKDVWGTVRVHIREVERLNFR